MTVRWNTVRMEKKLSDALALAQGEELTSEYSNAAAMVARETSQRIADSGRGGSHNAEFANIQHKAWRAGSGRYNISVGWLNPPSHAKEKGSGGRLWYQYQDMGFRLFGGNTWIEGVGAAIDQRERLLEALDDVNRRHLGRIAGILNR